MVKRKYMHRWKRLAIMITLFMVFAITPHTEAASIRMSSSKVTLYKGGAYRLRAVVNGGSYQVKWSTSNKKVVTVTQSGVVTAKKSGKATIKASAIGKTAKCVITVKNPSIKLNKKKATLKAGSTLQLKATIRGNSKSVVWSSGNTKIATVNSSGKVTAKKVGTVTIKAKANGKTAKCKITVKKSNKSKQALKAYKTILESGKRTYSVNGESTRMTIKKFALLDLDGDGTKELLVRNDNYSDILICGYNGTKVINMGWDYCYQLGDPKYNVRSRLLYFNRYDTLTLLLRGMVKVNGNKITKINFDYMDPYANGNATYLINNEEVSSSTYWTKWSSVYGNSSNWKKVRFYSNTSTNRKKMNVLDYLV